jgi:hypothetical protein
LASLSYGAWCWSLNIAPPHADPETGLAAVVGNPLYRGLLRLAAACLMSIWIIDAGVVSARAGVRLEGSPEALRIEAVDAKLVDVLNELKAKFNLRYRANDALEGRITGSFRGSLQRVVARLLEGYDYVIAISPDGLDALILTQNATANVVVAKLPPTMPQAASPPVMTAREAKRAR